MEMAIAVTIYVLLAAVYMIGAYAVPSVLRWMSR
jgi:hypothetical protein